MLRRLFTFMLVLSLLLCVATSVLWVRSYQEKGELTLRQAGGGFQLIRTWRGMMLVRHTEANRDRPGAGSRSAIEYQTRPPLPQGEPEEEYADVGRPLVAAVVREWGPLQTYIPSKTESIQNRKIADALEARHPSLSGLVTRLAEALIQAAKDEPDEVRRRILLSQAENQQIQRAVLAVEEPESWAILRARWQVASPLWLVVSLLAVLPLAWMAGRTWRATHQNGRRRRGKCVVCGYDLRASPERCPECGAAPDKAAGRV